MTASDHATKPLRNTLRERGHPYMTLGARPHHAKRCTHLINRENMARAAPRDVRSMAGPALMAISYELSDVYRTPASQSCTKSQSDPAKMAPDRDAPWRDRHDIRSQSRS